MNLRTVTLALPLLLALTTGAEAFDPLAGLKTDAKVAKTPTECFKVQGTIAWALLRYNVFNNMRVTELTDGVFKALVRDRYLAYLPIDPGMGKGTHRNFRYTPDGGGIMCQVHGQAPAAYFPDNKVVSKILGNKCYRIQFNISTAVLRYNRANNLRITALTPQVAKALVAGGFLSSLPDDPGQGRNTFKNYMLISYRLGVTCMVHGAAPRP